MCAVSKDKPPKGAAPEKVRSFLEKLPADQQEEYAVGKGATVKGVGRLHSGWPNVKGVLKSSTNTDPYAEGDPPDEG